MLQICGCAPRPVICTGVGQYIILCYRCMVTAPAVCTYVHTYIPSNTNHKGVLVAQ